MEDHELIQKLTTSLAKIYNVLDESTRWSDPNRRLEYLEERLNEILADVDGVIDLPEEAERDRLWP